jgi:hypothetical protein
MIQKIPVKDAMSSTDFLLRGEVIDLIPDERDVYVDPRNGQTFDTSERVALRDLPAEGVIRLPRTTWG